MHKNLKVAGLFCLCAIFAQSLFAQSRSAELSDYKSIFSKSSVVEQKSVCRKLQWAGISDTGLYDLIEKRLLASYTDRSKEKSDYNAWLAKALGFSGQQKYSNTLQEVANNAGHKGIKRHAKAALANLEKYKKWNPIISSTKTYNSGVSPQLNRYGNMLRSGDFELQTLAAKRINYEKLYSGAFILGELDKAVKAAYLNDDKSRPFVNALVNMTKMLAASGNKKYRATVLAVAENAPNKRVRRSAAKFLKTYYID